MEEHLADMNKAQKAKLARASNRAVELEDLRPSQGNQMMEPTIEGAGSGGRAGLARVIGAGKKRKGMKEMEMVMEDKEMTGGFWGALASLAVPLIGKLFGKGAMNKEAHDKMMALMRKRKVGDHTKMSGGFWGALASLAVPLIGKLFGKGAMNKEAHDELMACMKKYYDGSSMKGGAYVDSQFGMINEPAPMPMKNMSGGAMPMDGGAMCGAGKYGKMLREHLTKTQGAGFVRDFTQGFMGEAKPDIHSTYRADTSMRMSNSARMVDAKRRVAVGGGPFSPMALKMILPRKEAGIVELGAGRAGAGRAGAGRAGAGRAGAGVSDVRKRRGQAVSRLMREEGMTLGEASKYLKEHPEAM